MKIERYKEGKEDIIATIHNEGFSEWIESVGISYGYEEIHQEDVALWPGLNNVFLVEMETEPVAYAHVRMYPDDSIKIGSFHVVGCCEYGQSKLTVVPRCRGRGIGTELLRHCIYFFDQNDVEQVRVHVYNDNRVARRLLELQGFRHTDVDIILAEIDLTKDLPLKHVYTSANIRIAGEEDAPMLLEFSQEAEGKDTALVRASTVDEAKAYILRDDLEVVVIAELQGKIVGCFDAEKFTGHLGLNVHLGYRRQGIGSALMHKVLTILRERGYAKALTDSEANRIPAHALYRKFGSREKRRVEQWVKTLR